MGAGGGDSCDLPLRRVQGAGNFAGKLKLELKKKKLCAQEFLKFIYIRGSLIHNFGFFKDDSFSLWRPL